MAQDYTPDVWDWEPITVGCTYPAANIFETVGEDPTETILNRVVVTIQPRNSDVDSLVLDSDTTGVTINSGVAGAWDVTVDEISAADITALGVGLFDVNVTITHNTTTVVCVSKGIWKILPQ